MMQGSNHASPHALRYLFALAFEPHIYQALAKAGAAAATQCLTLKARSCSGRAVPARAAVNAAKASPGFSWGVGVDSTSLQALPGRLAFFSAVAASLSACVARQTDMLVGVGVGVGG